LDEHFLVFWRIIVPLSWGHHSPSECWASFTQRHTGTSHETWFIRCQEHCNKCLTWNVKWRLNKWKEVSYYSLSELTHSLFARCVNIIQLCAG
jgi:hypothetical protein